MKAEYPIWLKEKHTKSASTKLAQIKKIEKIYGNLDDHFKNGSIQTVVNELIYSANDERQNKPNPSKIAINGSIRKGLASYKSAISYYKNFLNDNDFEIDNTENLESGTSTENNEEVSRQRFALERDMQKALREDISSLETNLRIIDDGAERAVNSGFIDITCEDDTSIVIIELKAGKADSRAIGQVLGYMGDIQDEEERNVRGILIAHDFDKRAEAAARVVPTLTLKKYSIEFKFLNT